MKTPTIQDKELRPLNTYRWSTVKDFLQTEHGRKRDSEITVILTYIALAMSDDEKSLHLDYDVLAEAVVDAGINVSDEDFLIVGEYMTKVLDINKKSEFTTESGKQV